MSSSSSFISFPIDGGLILARSDGERLFVMNDAARFIWEQRTRGIPDADIPALMAGYFGIDRNRAEQDFRDILARWQVEGLAPLSGNRRYYRIGGRCFSVSYPDQSVEDAMRSIVGHLELAASDAVAHAPEREFALHLDSGRYVLRASGGELLSSAEIDEIIAKLAHATFTLAFDNEDWLISTHAAAVARGRGCALLPGISGSGKSTLTAALLARPSIRYLTDDLSLLDRTSLHVIPVPGALVLKRGSWEALAPLLPTLASRPVHRRYGGDVRYHAPPPEQIAPASLPVELVVFPRYVAGAEVSCAPISMLEGLTHLIAAPCMIRPPITQHTMSRLAAWARAIRFYTLTYGSVAEAAAKIDEMLGS